MYRFLFGLAALAAALALPLNASADTIDDFVITGNGHTITYSLPATTVFGYCFSCDFFYVNAEETIDGVPGYQSSQGYAFYPAAGNLQFFVPESIFGYQWILFQGPLLVSTEQIPSTDPFDPNDPYDFASTFIPGTYSLIGAGMTPYPMQTGPDVPYTLTITPQTETAATPEPPTLALLATGLFGLFVFRSHQGQSHQSDALT